MPDAVMVAQRPGVELPLEEVPLVQKLPWPENAKPVIMTQMLDSMIENRGRPDSLRRRNAVLDGADADAVRGTSVGALAARSD